MKVSDPPPVLDTVTVLAAGLPCPTVALNASEVGDTDSVGVDVELSVGETGTCVASRTRQPPSS